jgi:hypothetical protein
LANLKTFFILPESNIPSAHYVEQNLSALLTRLDDHIKESDRRHEETSGILKDYKIMINSKISKEQFGWVIGILVTVLIAMFGYIAVRMDSFAETSAKTQSDVSFLTGKLTPYNVQFKN